MKPRVPLGGKTFGWPIGQLLDYARYLEAKHEPLTLCVLTPTPPASDMIDLVLSLNGKLPYKFGVAWEEGSAFKSMPAGLLNR